jgi:hypothetical protein
MQMAAAQTEAQLTCPLVSSDEIIDAAQEIAGVGRELFAATAKADSEPWLDGSMAQPDETIEMIDEFSIDEFEPEHKTSFSDHLPSVETLPPQDFPYRYGQTAAEGSTSGQMSLNDHPSLVEDDKFSSQDKEEASQRPLLTTSPVFSLNDPGSVAEPHSCSRSGQTPMSPNAAGNDSAWLTTACQETPSAETYMCLSSPQGQLPAVNQRHLQGPKPLARRSLADSIISQPPLKKQKQQRSDAAAAMWLRGSDDAGASTLQRADHRHDRSTRLLQTDGSNEW